MKKQQSTRRSATSGRKSLAVNSRNELEFIQQGDTLLYDARLLHKKLQVKTKFEDWIKRRIKRYRFMEGLDYFSNLRIVKHSKKPITEYLLTIDTAKEMAMVEENEIGRKIRRMFIAKEKELRALSLLPKAPQLFKGLKAKWFNNNEMYPYREIKRRSGYSIKSSSANHKNRYWMHFVKEGALLYCTKAFSLQLYYQKQVINNRTVLVNMNPVLPQNFGDVSVFQPGLFDNLPSNKNLPYRNDVKKGGAA